MNQGNYVVFSNPVVASDIIHRYNTIEDAIKEATKLCKEGKERIYIAKIVAIARPDYGVVIEPVE